MNITPRSSKDEVISNACELVDLQEKEIETLKGQQTTLFYLLGGIAIFTLIFWFYERFCEFFALIGLKTTASNRLKKNALLPNE